MSIEAAALLHAPYATFSARFKPEGGTTPGAAQAELQGADGKLFRLTALDDGCVAWTSLDFAADPADLAAALRRMLGDALDLHQEPRGLFVFPARARPRSKRYTDAVDELGELGSWAKIPSAAEAAAHHDSGPRAGVPDEEDVADEGPTRVDFGMPGGMPGLPGMGAMGAMDPMALMQQLGGLLSAIPPEAMAAMQQAMAAGEMADPEKVMERLQGAMGAGGMEQLQQSLMGAMSNMDPSLLEGLQSAMENPPEGDEGEMIAQAEAQLEELRKKDPAKFAELEKQFGGALPFPPKKK